GLTLELATQLLQHPQAEIRTWSVRLVTDHATPEGMKSFESLLPQLVNLAQRESSPTVQVQLAITARRTILGTKSTQWCYAIISELTKHQGPFDDSQLPLLIWWAVEAAITFDDASFASSSLQLPGSNPLHAFLAERIARRLLASESSTSMSALEQLLQVWPNHRSQLLQGMELALAGKRLKHAPLAIIKQLRTSSIPTMRELPLLIRLGDPLASKTGYAILEQGSGSERIRAPILQALSDGEPISSELLLRLFTDAQTDPFRNTILNALASRMNPNVVQSLLSQYSKSSKTVRNQLLAMLLARRESALLLCQAIEGNQVPSKDLSLDQVQQLAHLGDSNIDTMVRKHWGSIKPQTTGEKRARINSVLHMLNQRAGDPTKGLALFTQHCASCHQLFGSGGKIGPDLTTADRQRNFLATHIVDPNLMIRPEYAAQTIITTDGRTLTGLLIDQNANTLTLVDAQTNRTVLNRTQIDIMQPAKQSLMPEKLLDPLDDDQIRHLFAYLQLPVEAGLKYQHSELPFRAEQIKEPVKFDFADKMLSGMERFLEEELAAAPKNRDAAWQQDISAPKVLDNEFFARRQDLREMIGAVGTRWAIPEMEFISSPEHPSRIALTAHFIVDHVRWRPKSNLQTEGLLVTPTGQVRAQVVVIPDADETPEQLLGLQTGIPPTRQIGRRLAEQGCQVLIPT
ncbi:MAG TPA: c-type cytochrome, partial [Gemmatales bacterium]|nr:c-type cytochrome [Gemmatales bacterium]